MTTGTGLARVTKKEAALGSRVWGDIKARENDMDAMFSRMDEDFSLYKLDPWVADDEEPISAEDTYTTNASRVLAKKIIAFISNTELVTRIPNDEADDQQEDINDKAERLGIGMLNHADKRLRRSNRQTVQDQLGWYSVVRGGFTVVRAMLRKKGDGNTFVDILPIDPRNFVLQMDEEEPVWAAHRFILTRKEIMRKYPKFAFSDEKAHEESVGEEAWEVVRREKNPDFDPLSPNPFVAHMWTYEIGTLIDGRWARKPHRVFTLMFPLIAVPVDEQPMLVPGNSSNDKMEEIASFGESIFAENRSQWAFFNRWMSYNMKMMADAADPSSKVYSIDGTKTLDDGVNEKGTEINLSTANQEDVVLNEVADAKNSTQISGQMLNNELVAGGIPPQAVGLLDKPLSAVALRQLGSNLEHKVLPRMRAVARTIETALELMIGQYETGAFEPLTVSGTRASLARFASQRIAPEDILGHDPIEVRMELSLPEDETTRWTVAQMALQPIAPDGAPLMSREWVQEKILKVQSPKTIFRQNLERVALTSNPVAAKWEQLQMALKEGNQLLAAALYDELRMAVLQQQVMGSLQLQQLEQMALGIGIDPSGADAAIAGQAQATGGFQGNNQALNPANGAVPFAQAAGVGNTPSPQAGFNTTASRQRDTGLVSPNGAPLLAEG